MKIWMLLAAVVLVPVGVSARSGSSMTPADENARAQLIREVEANRAALLPQTRPIPPVTLRHQPRLNEIKASIVSAKTSAQLLMAQKDFNDWKDAVLLSIESERLVPGGEAGEILAARRAAELVSLMSSRQQFVARRFEAGAGAIPAASRNPAEAKASWSGVFDNAVLSSKRADGAVQVPTPRVDSVPDRYGKIRALLLSRGVSRKVIDTAIAEGISQKVDPMIVLSVIDQESRFKKDAHNKGSGCKGLMQLAPGTAADMGVRGDLYNTYDEDAHIEGGVKYIHWIANRFWKMKQDMSDISKIPAESLKIVLASYNWGVGNVQRLLNRGGTLESSAPKETRNYILEIPQRIRAWFASF